MTRPRGRVLAALGVGAAVLAIGVVAVAVLTGGSSAPSLVALGPAALRGRQLERRPRPSVPGRLPYFVGGGVATFDCDGDQRPELYLAGGAAPAALYRNDSPAGGPLSFAPVQSPATDLVGVTGAYPLDIDSDGLTDLVVLRTDGNVLLRGLGGCAFERANEAWGFDGGSAWTTAFSATWETGSSWPTLAFGNYLELVDGEPDRGTCADGELVRPTGGAAPYASPVPLSPSWCSLSLLFSDWSRTGQRDLRVSNDRHYYSDYSDGQEQLWRIAAGAAPTQYAEADGWQRVRVEGMGIASQDVTGDGLPDVYLTSQAASRLETLANGAARPEYRNMAFQAGVEGAQPSAGGDHRPSTAWQPRFEDVNADGLMDLFVTKGNVDSQPDFAEQDPNELYLGQPDGTFVVATSDAGVVDMGRSRGAALVDLDLDGLLDLVVVEREAPVGIWRGLGAGTDGRPAAMGHWVAVTPRQTGANRDAIGAWVEVRSNGRTIAREVTVGGGHGSGTLGPVRVGLGDATSAEVRVRWPDGVWGEWSTVQADAYQTIDRETSPAAPVATAGAAS
ncbi:MAG: CRTAC1 family protein [Chloroflexota bacterium]